MECHVRYTPITVPTAGDRYSFGSSYFDILGPINSSDEPNNTSIVLKLTFGKISFLFTGDAERDEEQDILSAGYDLSATVLKVGHHGSDTSTTYPFLREIMPQYAVISVGQGNTYGHPTEDTLSRLRDADVTTYRTDIQGTIICTSDGETVSFSTERNADVDTLDFSTADGKYGQSVVPSKNEDPSPSPSPAPVTPVTPASAGTTYILNTNTYKFHYPSCSSVDQMKDSNKKSYTGTRDDIISMGYVPCKKCNP
ncbi:Metallo-beta-lactamase domain protein (fragment) [uncultured Eubacteriales bacterium]|uniref:Metallo-beta-lactamase domain protein n=1 Tax=uncultured Eubacteriales bacterium TaxID=172733 RepID=A0A212JT80_9FIRM